MMKRRICLLALPLLSMAACLDMSDQDSTETENADIKLAIAPAATTSGPCPQGSVCLYQNGHQTGAGVFVTAGISIANLGTISCPACTNGVNGSNGTFNDQMSSWKNASNMNYCWFPNTNFTGATHLMLAGSQNTLPAEYNDHASSLKAGNCP